MSKTFALVFPGQGSQHLGMLGDLATQYTIIQDTFNQASDKLGYDLWALTQQGPEEKLNQTEFTQPALLAAGVAVWKIWQQLKAPTPKFLAGHSLGEYTALVCAEVLNFEETIKLVEKRGKFMQAAVPAGEGAMAAIIGLSEEEVKQVCESASQDDQTVSPANYNSIGQIVVAGAMNAVDQAVVLAKEKGAKIAKKLPVSVPSHCELMKPAALQLAEELKAMTFKKLTLPVINNVDVCCYQDPRDIQDALVRQLYNPVRWVETIQFFISQQVLDIIESGPGKVLTGLNKRIDDKVIAVAITQPDSLQEVLKNIGD